MIWLALGYKLDCPFRVVFFSPFWFVFVGQNCPFPFIVDNGLGCPLPRKILGEVWNSTFCIGMPFWCKEVRSKQCVLQILANGLLECVEGFEIVVSLVEIALA